jgi:hypothetical protein
MSLKRPDWLDRTAVAVLVILVGLVALGLIVGTAWQPTTKLSLEAGKFFLQAVFVVAVGAVVAFYVQKRRETSDALATEKREAELRDERQRSVDVEALRAFLERIDDSYIAVKRIRRELAAHIGPELLGSVSGARYWSSMTAINEEQMNLEQVSRDFDSLQQRFPGDLLPTAEVDAMERYLKRLWDECEDHSWTQRALSGEDLPALVAFLASARTGRSSFQTFVVPYRDARRSLIMTLVARRVHDVSPDTRARSNALDGR